MANRQATICTVNLAVEKMTIENPQYSIIVPSHNKKDDLVRCLQGLIEQETEGRRIEIIVIDDGSTDGTGDAVRAFEAGEVPLRYYRLEGRGPATARNEGIRHARGRVVCMIDDDAVPQPGWFLSLVRPFESDDEIVGVEGKVVPTGVDYGPLGMSPVNLEGGVFLTCNIAYRRDALLRVGGFDEGFPYPACEDADLAAAISEYGRISWAPGAEVHHPRRRWSFQRAVREVRFFEAFLRYACRYGAMGWKERPTRFPVARTVWSAVVALPAGRVRKGIRMLPKYPRQATEFIGIAVGQAVVAAFLIWRPVIKAVLNPTPLRETSLQPSR